MILSQALNESGSRNWKHPALLDLGQTIPFDELRDRVGRLSNLYQTEFPYGARVAMVAQNSLSFAQTFFALSNSGNPVLLIDPRDLEESIAEDIRNLDIRAILVTRDQASRMAEIIRRQRLSAEIIEMEKRRAGEYDTGFQSLPDRPLRDVDPVLILRHSSTTSGRYYCIFDHKQIITATNGLKSFYKLTPSDRLLTTMPWSHPFSLTHGLLLPLLSGATCVIDPQCPSVEEFVDHIAKNRITRFVGTPQFFFQLLNFCASQKYTLPGVKSITVGVGSLSLALRKTYKLLKIPVLRCYGRTEALWSLAMDRLDEALDIESARSHPLPGVRIAVLSEGGEEIAGPDRREGLLTVMADSITRKYFHSKPELAEKKLRELSRGTWLKADDVARLENDGDNLTVAVLGKASDMLLAEGNYLSPRPIDAVAMKVPGVTDAAGFVRFDRENGPTFAVALVMDGGKVNEKDILHRFTEDLPDEQQPHTVHFVSSIPRDAFASIDRLALQKQFSAS